MFLDNSSFEQLYYEYNERLLNFAFHFVGDRQLAQDLIHESYVRLWEKYSGKESAEWHPLLFRIVRNRCLDYLRHLSVIKTERLKESLKEVCAEKLYYLDFDFNGSDGKTILDELVYETGRIMHHLPDRCREVFILSRFRGMKNREIADLLQISEKAVEKHITKALKIFQKELSRSGYIYSLAMLLFFVN